MNIKSVVECLNENKINFPKEFLTIERDGCIGEYESLMKSNLEAIETSVKFGVNNGFSGDLKTNISDLIKITVKLTKEKKSKKLDKYCKESSKIIKETEKIMKNKELQPTMVKEVLKYVEAYERGMIVLLGMPVAEDRKHILKVGLDKLNALKSVLKEVADESTPAALEYAKNIVGELNEWADIVADKMHSESSLDYLENAIKQAEEWKKLHKAVKKGLFGKSNKVKDLKDIEFMEDNLTMIARSQGIIRDINIFSENLSEYRKTLEAETWNIENDTKLLEEKVKEKEELEKKKNDLVVKFKNGEISKDDLYNECVIIDEDIVDIDEDAEDIKIGIEEKKADARSIGNVIENLEKLNREILKYKSDPIYISLIGENIDFSALSKVMRGAGTSADIDYVLDIESILSKIRDERKKKDEELNATAKAFRRKRRDKWVEERKARHESRAQEENGRAAQTEKEKDDYINKLLNGKDSENSVNEEQPQTETAAAENVSIALSDDDK